MIRTVLGVWYGLIDGLEWLGARTEPAFLWFVVGAVYGALMVSWVMR